MNDTFKVIKRLESKINFLLSSNYGESLILFYNRRFNIPKRVVRQYLKQRIASNYIMKYSKFNNMVKLPYILISIIKYLVLVTLCFIFSKKIKTKKQEFDLLVDDIQHDGEIERWHELEANFSREKTVYIAKYLFIKPLDKNLIYQERLKGYDRMLLIKSSFQLFFSDLINLIWHSFKLNLNLIHIHSFFINDYLYFSSLFKICSAKYLIQDRNLGRTNALKNHLFKASGGILSTCIQKNIVQHNNYALFYDTDIFFSYGDKTADDILSLGGRIISAVPVGSLAMDNSSFKIKNIIQKENAEIDILYIGINAVKENKTDWTSYYESIVWLAKLAKNFPNLSIAIKHHLSWRPDQKELGIIKDSGIEYLDKKIDSYSLAFKSSYILTYGSSMGYELMGHGLNVIFVNPNHDNPFINNFVYSDKNVANSFADLEFLILNSNNINQNEKSIERNNYCYTDERVSNRVYDYLCSYQAN